MEDIKMSSIDNSSNVIVVDPLASEQGLQATRVTGKNRRLERYLTFLPMIAFCSTLQASWESVGAGLAAGLLNGGPVGLVYGFILAAIGTTCLACSFAEMASITPVAGAQYHWTADYAPFAPKFWSLFQGWITVFAFMSSACGAPFFAATQIQGLVVINYPTYVPERWHATLMMWAIIALPLLANLWARKVLAPLEIVGGIWHIITLPILMIVLITLSPISSNEFVWKTLVNSVSGWENKGIAFSIGMLSSAFPLTGFDGVLHMAEETKNAPRTVPRSMVLAVTTNSVLAFGYLITLLYCLGDYLTALESPSGYPIIQIYQNATGTPNGAAALMSLGLVTAIIALFSILASVSRLVWAFARDGGLPFSDFFVVVHPTLKIPVRTLSLVIFVMVALSFIVIGSSTAFEAILSLGTLSSYISYVIPTLFVLIRKLQTYDTMQWGPWKMPKVFGMCINGFGVIYGIYIIIFLPFPTILPVTAENMNYAGPIVGAVIVMAIADWCCNGRTRWQGPAGRYIEDPDELDYDDQEQEQHLDMEHSRI